MTVNDIISGESEYLEFKQEVPKKSEVYMKTVVAFANGSGGKIVFGVEDSTFKVVGINQEDAFSIMDGITSAICDSCTPMITPIVTLASVEEKVVIVVNIMPGSQRPYYLTAKGKENGTYIRVSGTTRPADSFVLRELEFEGVNRCFDQNYAAPEASVCICSSSFNMFTSYNVHFLIVYIIMNRSVILNVNGSNENPKCNTKFKYF